MANQITSNYKLNNRIDMLKFQYSNKRKAVRYIRNDIDAAVTKIKVFRTNKLSYVILHDISTRGAFISTDLNLSLNKKLTLTLVFAQGRKFAIPAKIVRKDFLGSYKYGLQFDCCNDSLGDYLLTTQSKLIFK